VTELLTRSAVQVEIDGVVSVHHQLGDRPRQLEARRRHCVRTGTGTCSGPVPGPVVPGPVPVPVPAVRPTNAAAIDTNVSGRVVMRNVNEMVNSSTAGVDAAFLQPKLDG